MGRFVTGMIIVLCGVVVLLNTLHLTDVSLGYVFGTYFWPAIFILAGISFLTTRHALSFPRVFIGVILVAFGVLYLGNQLDWFNVVVGDLWSLFWPALIIVIGLNILTGRRRYRRRDWKRDRDRYRDDWHHDPASPDQDERHDANGDPQRFAMFGNVESHSHKWDLKGGDYWAILGGVNLDLRNAVIPEGETKMTVTAVLGSIEIVVPQDLTVVCEGTTVLGSLELLGKTTGGVVMTLNAHQGDAAGTARVVRIECTTVLGSAKVYARP